MIKELYETDKDFRSIVDKEAKQTGKSVEELFEHAMTKEIAKYYFSKPVITKEK